MDGEYRIKQDLITCSIFGPFNLLCNLESKMVLQRSVFLNQIVIPRSITRDLIEPTLQRPAFATFISFTLEVKLVSGSKPHIESCNSRYKLYSRSYSKLGGQRYFPFFFPFELDECKIEILTSCMSVRMTCDMSQKHVVTFQMEHCTGVCGLWVHRWWFAKMIVLMGMKWFQMRSVKRNT